MLNEDGIRNESHVTVCLTDCDVTLLSSAARSGEGALKRWYCLSVCLIVSRPLLDPILQQRLAHWRVRTLECRFVDPQAFLIRRFWRRIKSDGFALEMHWHELQMNKLSWLTTERERKRENATVYSHHGLLLQQVIKYCQSVVTVRQMKADEISLSIRCNKVVYYHCLLTLWLKRGEVRYNQKYLSRCTMKY